MAKDKSLAGAITGAALYGLRIIAIGGAIGGLAYVVGDHFYKEATAPGCGDDIKTAFTNTAGLQGGLMTRQDGSLCRLTFTPS